jgi:DNA primase
VVGWTARKITDGKPKYISEQQPGYVFNLDAQNDDRIYTIVVEGPLDAVHLGGVALMGSEIKDQQALQINRLGKQVILVPDRDRAGSKLVEPALELGWSVSMPDWPEGINDVGDAVQRYGRLYALYMIVSSAEDSGLKTRLRARHWFLNT